VVVDQPGLLLPADLSAIADIADRNGCILVPAARYAPRLAAEGDYHAIRDLNADSYGGWAAVTNIQAGGGLYAQRIVTRRHYDLDHAKEMAMDRAGLAKSDGHA
jgi:hypothetical protein